MLRVIFVALITLAIFCSTASASISGITETQQVVTFTGVTPNTQYASYFYAYRYAGDLYPYALGYSGLPSNYWGEYKASVALGDLSSGDPVYSIKACLLALPSYNQIYCTPYTYVGYIPIFEWTYR